MIYFHIFLIAAILAFLARVGPIYGDELLVEQFICFHMTELRVDKSVNIIFQLTMEHGWTCTLVDLRNVHISSGSPGEESNASFQAMSVAAQCTLEF